MLWLFGQIWLWLVIAFALGAGLTALVATAARRRREPAVGDTAPSRSEAEFDDGYDEYDDYDEVDDERHYLDVPPPDVGHREGTLPGGTGLPEREDVYASSYWHADPDWPQEHDLSSDGDGRQRQDG
jgi:hypothetical protein